MKNLNKKINQQGFFNAGHYYSPIPHREDIKLYKNKKDSPEAQLPDINLNRENQKKILDTFTIMIILDIRMQSSCLAFY